MSGVTPGFDQHFIPVLNSADYPSVDSTDIANGQPDPALQLPGFDGDSFFATFTSLAQSDGLTAIANGQPDPTLQLHGFVGCNDIANSTSPTQCYGLTGIASGQPDPTLQPHDFVGHNDIDVYNDFNVMPDDFAYSNSLNVTQWHDSTAIDPPETMASFNQLPLPIFTGMSDALALPTDATSGFTTPAVPLPIARTEAPRRSNVNNNTHICDSAGCGKTFTRPSDLARHRHQHGVPGHPCLVNGCNRRRSRAFFRADKLHEHQRKRHGMNV